MKNDLGVDPTEWFENPLDSMPIATDKGSLSWEDTAPSEYEPPDEPSIHEKMYRMATSSGKHTVGGGSEERMKEEFTPENDPYGGY